MAIFAYIDMLQVVIWDFFLIYSFLLQIKIYSLFNSVNNADKQKDVLSLNIQSNYMSNIVQILNAEIKDYVVVQQSHMVKYHVHTRHRTLASEFVNNIWNQSL